jgi:Kef-type K+ transport system membrane component KefB/Trk K+ transport system NAD-binding subunit
MAGAAPTLVQDIGVCLVGAAGLSVLFQRLHLPHVAAFLAAGVLLGPVGLSLVTDSENIETIAHLGLTLLLFLIGLEIDLRDLLNSGRALLLGGALQVPLSVVAGVGAVALVALAGAGPAGTYGLVYAGLVGAFSSTLLVVSQLQALRRMDTTAGRLALGLLIFQDIWAIVFLAVQPDLASPAVSPVLSTLGGIGVVATLAAVCSRYVLPPAFRLVAKHPELLVTAALGWCFGLGLTGAHLADLARWVGLDLPISVSMEMGALIAGTSIATFPYAHDVVGKIGNLRDFFITLFFVALGMSIPVPDVSAVVLAGVLVAMALVVRGVVFFPLVLAGGAGRRSALETSLALAPISEFGLVIVYLGAELGHVEKSLVTAVTLAFAATAIGTPAFFWASDRVDGWISPWFGASAAPSGSGTESARPPRIVLLGFHRVASSLLADLHRDHPHLLPDVLVVDFNVAIHPHIRATGAQVVYGDLRSQATLEHAVHGAQILVSSVPDELLKGIDNLTLVRRLRALAPGAAILAHASHPIDAGKLEEAGADWVFSTRTETAIGLWHALEAALEGDIDRMRAGREALYGALAERREIVP